MKPFLVHRPTVLASVSPYRLLDEHGQEIAWANAFLDGQCIRQLSLRSLRAYAYDLLHFARWWSERLLPQPLSEITESTLLDYVRYQLDQEPKPTPYLISGFPIFRWVAAGSRQGGFSAGRDFLRRQ